MASSPDTEGRDVRRHMLRVAVVRHSVVVSRQSHTGKSQRQGLSTRTSIDAVLLLHPVPRCLYPPPGLAKQPRNSSLYRNNDCPDGCLRCCIPYQGLVTLLSTERKSVNFRVVTQSETDSTGASRFA